MATMRRVARALCPRDDARVPSAEVKERLAADVALWQADGIIDDATRRTLQARYDTPGFGLATAVRYLGIVGGLLAALGLLGLLTVLSESLAVATVLLGAVGAGLLWAGLHFARDPRARYVHSSKVVLTLGVLGWGGACALGASAAGLDNGAVLFIAGAGVVPAAFALAYRERNGLLLLCALLGVFHWLGSWSFMLGRGEYVFGVDEPRAMAPIAAAVLGFGLWQRGPGRFPGVYQAVALVYLNLSLLLLSIYPEATATPFILVFTAAALGQIVLGARLQNALVMGFGVTALALDLFTRFFEHMWGLWGRGLFFFVGGLLLVGFGAGVEIAYRRWSRP
jgi:hypothetical protein